MAAVVEAVGLYVGDIRVDDCDADVALALVVGLNVEVGRDFRDSAVDKLSRLDIARTERDVDIQSRVDGGQDVWYNIHLGDALHDDHTVVLAPLLVGEVAVDGLVHVACNLSV